MTLEIENVDLVCAIGCAHSSSVSTGNQGIELHQLATVLCTRIAIIRAHAPDACDRPVVLLQFMSLGDSIAALADR
jgi:hypothetical protein